MIGHHLHHTPWPILALGIMALASEFYTIPAYVREARRNSDKHRTVNDE